jgi:hypothetical protein
VERQQICHQVIVLNKLALRIAHLLGVHALATETHPLDEFVESLAFVGGGLNHLAQFRGRTGIATKKMVRTTRPSSPSIKAGTIMPSTILCRLDAAAFRCRHIRPTQEPL